MSGPATRLIVALQDWRLSGDSSALRSAISGENVTCEQVEAMDVAADVLAMNDGRPLLPHQALLISALKVEMERRKEGGA